MKEPYVSGMIINKGNIILDAIMGILGILILYIPIKIVLSGRKAIEKARIEREIRIAEEVREKIKKE